MKKKRIKVKAVIFDMDGVITHTMPYHYRAWQIVLKEEGIVVNYESIYKQEGQPGLEFTEQILYSKYRNSELRLKAKEILSKKEDVFKKLVKQRFVVGSRNFVKELHRKDFRLGLVTGTARHELHKILPDNIYKLFHAVVTGNDVKRGKPHPEPFEKSLSMLKLKPHEAVVIENAPFGICSAKQAGIQCLALETSLSRKFLKEADHVFANIQELRERILFENANHE